MVFLLFQMTSAAVAIPTSADLEFTLPRSRLNYTLEGGDFDFTLPQNKLDFTVDE